MPTRKAEGAHLLARLDWVRLQWGRVVADAEGHPGQLARPVASDPLQWGRVVADAEGIVDYGGIPEHRMLQWGRVVADAEG